MEKKRQKKNAKEQHSIADAGHTLLFNFTHVFHAVFIDLLKTNERHQWAFFHNERIKHLRVLNQVNKYFLKSEL